jgi:hypothetical protein
MENTKKNTKMYMLLTGLLIIGVVVTLLSSCSKNNTTSQPSNHTSTIPNGTPDLAGTWVNTTNSSDWFVMRDTINDQYSIYAGTFIYNYDNYGYSNTSYPVVIYKSKLTTPPGFDGQGPTTTVCNNSVVYSSAFMMYQSPYLVISMPGGNYVCGTPGTIGTNINIPSRNITFMKY